MSLFARLSLRFWFIAPLLALGFLLWIHGARAHRVEAISTPAVPVAIDAKSPTGYAGGVRMLIAPGHNNESYQWIVQTQQMIAQGEWRLRHVAYDNAPTGRPIHTSSPYRWWLATVAWGSHMLSGEPIGLAVEKAALWADPLLQILLLAFATAFTAWRFGRLPALLVALATALLFPLAGGFVPGAPDARNLTNVILFASVLTLLAGVLAGESLPNAKRWFATAGALGGLALWLDVGAATMLVCLGLGGVAAEWFNRKKPGSPLPWRAWALAGAAAALAGYLVEYAPAHLDLKAWRLSTVHPLYALAWLGGGELLARLSARFRGRTYTRRDYVMLAGAALALSSVPLVMWLKSEAGFLAPGTFASRLTLLDDAPGADNFAKWIVQGGLTFKLVATCLPLFVVGLALWQFFRRSTPANRRIAIALLLVPAAVAFVFACADLSWWSPLQFVLLALLVATAAGAPGSERQATIWLATAGLALLPGLLALLPPRVDDEKPNPSRAELQSLAEREFAQWLARRRGEEGAIVLAPPNLTVSLIFHGGLQGLGTPYRENEDGFRASVRLAGAVHADEAHALARQRGVTHIVMPSWDGFLDEYARLGGAAIEQTFMGLLHSWLPPRWLRPVAYYLPNTETFANEQLFIFEQTEIQDNATSLSRLAEYFLDMGQPGLANQVAQALAHEYAADVGAQVAKARVDIVNRDRASFTKTVETIATSLAEGSDALLPWDRRVSLCLVLTTGERAALAKEQTERCLYEMSETELRTLSEPTLLQFLLLCKSLQLEIEDPQLRELALSLLPAEVRHRL